MTTRIIRNEGELSLLIDLLREKPRPYTVDIVKGERRSSAQNRLQRKWIGEIAEQLDQTQEEIRGFCKLLGGVPILRAENTLFRERYDAVIRPMSYDHKILAMMEPLNMPVTRIMSVEQKSRYLDWMFQFFTERGVVLTQPKKGSADDQV